MRGRGSRGVSTIVLAFLIMIATVLTAMSIVVVINSFSNTALTSTRNTIKYTNLQQLNQIVINRTPSYISFVNIGPSDVVIDRVVIRTYTGEIKISSVREYCSSNVIPSLGDIRCIHVPGEYVAFTTPDGIVIYPSEPVVRAQFSIANSTKIIVSRFNLDSWQELESQFNVSRELLTKPYPRGSSQANYTGMNATYIPILQQEFYNVSVATSPTGISFGIVVVGYDPSWVIARSRNPNQDTPPRYTLMLINPPINENIQIAGRNYSFPNYGVRLLISNFTGTIRISANGSLLACSSSYPGACTVNRSAIGFWYYGLNLSMRIYINGTSSYIANYTRTFVNSSATRSTSYLPYLFLGDVDGNGLNDLVFITEDATYGSSNSLNDRWGGIDLIDWSVRPLALILTQIGRDLGSQDGSIDGRVIGGVVIFLNIFFRDNSHPDTLQLQDVDRTDWVLRILLIDESGDWQIIREYRYQEICLYHKTLVTDFANDNYFTKISQSIYVTIPDQRKYWIGIAIQDSYSSERNTYNDVDFTVGIELIGALPIHR